MWVERRLRVMQNIAGILPNLAYCNGPLSIYGHTLFTTLLLFPSRNVLPRFVKVDNRLATGKIVSSVGLTSKTGILGRREFLHNDVLYRGILKEEKL